MRSPRRTSVEGSRGVVLRGTVWVGKGGGSRKVGTTDFGATKCTGVEAALRKHGGESGLEKRAGVLRNGRVETKKLLGRAESEKKANKKDDDFDPSKGKPSNTEQTRRRSKYRLCDHHHEPSARNTSDGANQEASKELRQRSGSHRGHHSSET